LALARLHSRFCAAALPGGGGNRSTRLGELVTLATMPLKLQVMF